MSFDAAQILRQTYAAGTSAMQQMSDLTNPIESEDFVERGELDSPALDAYLQQRLGPWRERADAAVLGCTHFPFLREAIRKALNPNAVLYDGGAGTARQTRRQLELRDLRREGDAPGTVQIENSLGTPEILERSRRLLEL